MKVTLLSALSKLFAYRIEPIPAKKIGYIPTLDGWRAIAILFVMFSHAADDLTQLLGQTAFTTFFADNGLFGVRIFFAISGFLITARILEEIQMTGVLNYRSFFIRRAFRILPPLFFFGIIIAILGVVDIIPISLNQWVGGMFFYANLIEKPWYIGHLWSLAVEEHFYLFWPFLFSIILIQRKLTFIFLIIFFLCLWRVIAWKFELYTSPAIFWGRTDIQLDGLLWGACAACIYQQLQRWEPGLLFKVLNILLFGILIFLMLSKFNDYKLNFIKYSVESFLIAYTILMFSLDRSYHKFFELTFLRWIGRISYSLYLWQQLFLVENNSKLQELELVQSLPINLILTFAAACFSYYLIERKFIKMGYKIAPPASHGRVI